ncbi:MAG: caspase family protein, partial [Phaeodactylibacter sp.]|nr:caspase family protein [Phaeodactylibacter sp.]
MKTLYALLVAVNDYLPPVNPLAGCLNDLKQLQAYLEAHCQANGHNFRPLVLANEQATRDNLVKSFEHFQKATEEDICLFFFAGHGSRCKAPDAFRHLSPSGKVESLVCWDSRLPGGRDLMDKELSFLIWKATQGWDVHFLAITDCCHSGKVTREAEVRLREVTEVGKMIPAEQYLGFEHYRPAGEGLYSPPRGRRYVHLGAARDVETAKEVYAKGAPRGVFSYSLVEALEQSNGQLSYAELAGRANLRVRSLVRDQSVQLDAANESDKKGLFLTGVTAGEGRIFLLAHDSKLGWVLNAGAIHGIQKGDEEFPTVFRVENTGQQITVYRVQANRSQVEGAEGLDKERQYRVAPVHLATPKLLLAFAEGSEEEGVTQIETLLQRNRSPLFSIVGDKGMADYCIHARQGAWFLSRLFDDIPLFQKVQGYTEAAATDFLNRLETVAHWQQLLRLSNPASSIRDNELDISLYRVREPGNTEDDAPVDLLDWRTVNDFEYVRKDGEWHRPSFQFKVKNTGHRTLWFSLLFLADDFSITNQLLPKQALEPEQEAWAFDLYDGHPYRTLPLEIGSHYLDKGIDAIEEYLKLI